MLNSRTRTAVNKSGYPNYCETILPFPGEIGKSPLGSCKKDSSLSEGEQISGVVMHH